MATKSYNSIQYDPNKDYSAAIKQALAINDNKAVNDLEGQRAAKIFGEKMDAYYNTVSPQYRNMAPSGTTVSDTGYTIKPADVVKGALDFTKGTTPDIPKADAPQAEPAKQTPQQPAQSIQSQANDFVKNNSGNYKINDNTSKYDQMAESQKQAAIARIKQAIADQTSGYEDTIRKAPEQFVGAKDQASYQGAKTNQAIQEKMAAMGLGNSGDNISATVANAAATGSNINALNQQEQQIISDAQAAIARLRNQEGRQIEEAVSGLDAQKMQNAIGEANRIDERTYDMGRNQLTDTLNAMGVIGNQQNADRSFGLQERSTLADMSGIDPITGKATMAKQGQDFSQNMQTKQFDTGVQQWNKEYKLKVDEVNTRNDQWDKQFNSQEEQRKIENDLNLNKFNFDKETTAWNQAFETRKVTFAEAQTAIDNSFREKQADIDNRYKAGQLSLQERELAHKINIDNQQLSLEAAKLAYQKSSGGSSSGGKFDTNTQNSIDDYSKYIEGNFGVQGYRQLGVDENGDPKWVQTGRTEMSPEQEAKVMQYVIDVNDSGENPAIVNSLVAKYGLGSKIDDYQKSRYKGSGQLSGTSTANKGVPRSVLGIYN